MKPSTRRDPLLQVALRISRARRLLVIDDHDSFRKIVTDALSPRGVSVKGAATGADGVALARVFQPEVILLDWVLKEMSGEAVARELKTALAGSPAFTVLLSGLMEDADRERAVRAGADVFLTKDAIYRILLPAQAGRRPNPDKSQRILAIEDEEGSQDYLRYVLSPRGYELVLVRDGRAGLLEARRQPPALILLDLNLPGLNGIEVYRALRSDPTLSRIPVIVMTAMDDASGVVDSLLQTILDSVDWVRKPLGENELTARVARALAQGPGDSPASVGPASDLILERGRIRVNVTRRQVWVSGRPRAVRQTRFDLLRILIAYDGALSAERISAEGWTGSSDPASMKKTVQRLRNDLGLPDDAIVGTQHGYRLVG